jgi:hypothetical protein
MLFVPDVFRSVTLIVVAIAFGTSVLAFLAGLALFLFVKGEMQMLEAGTETNTGPGSSTFSPSLSLTSCTIWGLIGRSLGSSVFV